MFVIISSLNKLLKIWIQLAFDHQKILTNFFVVKPTNTTVIIIHKSLGWFQSYDYLGSVGKSSALSDHWAFQCKY